MNSAKQEHFKQLLLSELRRHAQHIGEEQAMAIDVNSDDAKESSDLALHDVIQEMALKLGDRESQMVAEGFAVEFLSRVVMLERERIPRLRAFVFDSRNVGECWRRHICDSQRFDHSYCHRHGAEGNRFFEMAY